MKKKTRLLLADDHKLFVDGLIKMLETNKDLVVIGDVDNGRQLVNKYKYLKPDLMIIDITMPILSGIDALREILEYDRNAIALFLTMHSPEDHFYLCYQSGARGILNKTTVLDELVLAIETVMDGDYYFGGQIYSREIQKFVLKFNEASDALNQKVLSMLSRQEKEVFRLLGIGNTSAEIAELMGLSRRTIDVYRASIISKLELDTSTDLRKTAIKYKSLLEGYLNLQ